MVLLKHCKHQSLARLWIHYLRSQSDLSKNAILQQWSDQQKMIVDREKLKNQVVVKLNKLYVIVKMFYMVNLCVYIKVQQIHIYKTLSQKQLMIPHHLKHIKRLNLKLKASTNSQTRLRTSVTSLSSLLKIQFHHSLFLMLNANVFRGHFNLKSASSQKLHARPSSNQLLTLVLSQTMSRCRHMQTRTASSDINKLQTLIINIYSMLFPASIMFACLNHMMNSIHFFNCNQVSLKVIIKEFIIRTKCKYFLLL